MGYIEYIEIAVVAAIVIFTAYVFVALDLLKKGK